MRSSLEQGEALAESRSDPILNYGAGLKCALEGA